MTAKTTPTSSYLTFLMKKTETSWEKLCPITGFPDLGGEPDMLETTTLENASQTFIPGVQQQEQMAFTSNYIKDDYDKVKALGNDPVDLAVWFGGTVTNGVPTPTGSEGKWAWKGYVNVKVDGKEVNAVRTMTITTTPTTEVLLDTTSA